MKKSVKQILIGGLILALNGCYAPKLSRTDCPQNNTAIAHSQLENTGSLKKENSKNALVVLSPHFDDAALSAGGILSEFDGPKYIVTFFSTPITTTQYLTKWDEMSGFDKSTDARLIREQENANASRLIGANVINKDYADNQYEEPRSSSRISSLIESITQDIEQIIESVNEHQVTVIGPSYFGDEFTHPDHLIVSKAFMRAVNNGGHPNAHFYFYEDLPYTYKKFGKGRITIDTLLTNLYEGLCLDKKEIFISIESFNSKIEGIKLYPSQIKAFNSLGEDIAKDITEFGINRCPQFPLPLKPCEVIYEIRSMK